MKDRTKAGVSSGVGGRRVLGVSLVCAGVALALGVAFVVRQGVVGGPPAAGASVGPSALAIEEILRSSRVFLSQGEYGKAEAILGPAVREAPGDQDLRLARAEALLGLGKFEEAHEEFEAGIVIGPDAASLRFDAASVANRAGLTERAEEHYWEAQRLDPREARYPLYLAQVQRKLGKLTEAKKNLLLAVQLDPTLDIAWGVLADVALEENNVSIARTHVARARELAPERLSWRIVEARIERRDNRPERALALLTGLSAEARAQEPAVLREMALSLGLLKRPVEAAELYADAASMTATGNSALPELLREAAAWYERAGMLDEAIVYASRAMRAGDAEAGALMDRLERLVRPAGEGGAGGGAG